MERQKEMATPIIFFNGDVHEDELREFVKMIPKESRPEVDIVIGGSLILDSDEQEVKDALKIPVSMCVLDEVVITAYDYTEIMVDGDAYFAGNIDSMEIVVARDFMCDKNIDSTGVEAGGDAIVKGNVDTNYGEVKTLGDFICYGNCKSDVATGGSFICEGDFAGKVTKI